MVIFSQNSVFDEIQFSQKSLINRKNQPHTVPQQVLVQRLSLSAIASQLVKKSGCRLRIRQIHPLVGARVLLVLLVKHLLGSVLQRSKIILLFDSSLRSLCSLILLLLLQVARLRRVRRSPLLQRLLLRLSFF